MLCSHVFLVPSFPSDWANGAVPRGTAFSYKQRPKTYCNKPPAQSDARGSLLCGAIPPPAKHLLPQNSLLPTIMRSQIILTQVQPPSLLDHTPAPRGRQAPGPRNTAQGEDRHLESRKLFQERCGSPHATCRPSPLHFMPWRSKTVAPRPPSPKNTHLEADAWLKQALWTWGAATGVPQLRCPALGSACDW